MAPGDPDSSFIRHKRLRSKCKGITGVTLRARFTTVSCDLMALNALLMCREQQSLKMLATALDEFEIDQEICSSAHETIELITQGRYSALVLDFDLPSAALVARMARITPSRRRPLIFAMIGASTAIAGTFQAGANFVLYKPLVFEQLVRSFRAGRGFMQPDRRQSSRQKLEALVYLQFGIAALPAMVLDLNEQGMSLQVPEPLPPVQSVPFRFVLPGSSNMVEGTGDVIWADDCGRMGMLFSQLAPASRKQLQNWLGKRRSKKRTNVRTATRSERTHRTQSASH
jgi:CheY-like chemotaxis protein